MALKIHRYDDTNYTIVRTHYCDTADWNATTTAFARFRCRASCIVTSITLIVTSACSAAKVVFDVQRGASNNTAFTIVSATSVGAMTTVSCAITLASMELINLLADDAVGEAQVVYEYRVLPGQGMYDGL